MLECVPRAQPIERDGIFRPVGETTGVIEELANSGDYGGVVVWLWAGWVAEAFKDDNVLELGDVLGHWVVEANFALLDELKACDLGAELLCRADGIVETPGTHRSDKLCHAAYPEHAFWRYAPARGDSESLVTPGRRVELLIDARDREGKSWELILRLRLGDQLV